MSNIFVVKEEVKRNEYGEILPDCNPFEVVFYCDCVEGYPNSSKKTIEDIGGLEGVHHLYIAWIELCRCKCVQNCNVDIKEGYFAYFRNKYWKIIGIRDYDDCGCVTLKLVLDRLEPREMPRDVIECCNCFDAFDWCAKQKEESL